MRITDYFRGPNAVAAPTVAAEKEKEPADAASATEALSPPPAAPSQGIGSVFRQILSRYDIREISPREFSELIGRLKEANQISDAELKELSAMRVELDLAKADPDQPIDVLKFFTQKLRAQEDQASRPGSRGADAAAIEGVLAPIRRQVAWARKFAIAVSDGAGVDALA